MSNSRDGEAVVPRLLVSSGFRTRARWLVVGLAFGTFAGAWAGGGTDRYGEQAGFVGGIRGACGTIARGYRYTAATVAECVGDDDCLVRNLGLERQVETRLWQDKRLDAASIVVDVEEGGKAVLTGLVPDAAHKDRAVMLARDTRGVEVVVDQLAVATATRTIETTPAPDVPTGVALGSRVIR
jgi:hypothetical protein